MFSVAFSHSLYYEPMDLIGKSRLEGTALSRR